MKLHVHISIKIHWNATPKYLKSYFFLNVQGCQKQTYTEDATLHSVHLPWRNIRARCSASHTQTGQGLTCSMRHLLSSCSHPPPSVPIANTDKKIHTDPTTHAYSYTHIVRGSREYDVHRARQTFLILEARRISQRADSAKLAFFTFDSLVLR